MKKVLKNRLTNYIFYAKIYYKKEKEGIVMKKIEIEFLSSKFDKEKKDEDYIEAKFNLKKDIDDKEFNRFLYWIWVSKKKHVKEFGFDDYVYQKYPDVVFDDGKHQISFKSDFLGEWGGQFLKKEAFEMANSEDALNELYDEYLKVKDNFDFFAPLYNKATKGNRDAFVGLLLLDSTVYQEFFREPFTHNNSQSIYKLQNGEFFSKREVYYVDPYEDDFPLEKGIEFFLVKPVEKKIIEWKKLQD